MLNINGMLILGNIGINIIGLALLIFIYKVRCKVETERVINREEDAPLPQKTLAPVEPLKKEEHKPKKTSAKAQNQIEILTAEIERLKTL